MVASGRWKSITDLGMTKLKEAMQDIYDRAQSAAYSDYPASGGQKAYIDALLRMLGIIKDEALMTISKSLASELIDLLKKAAMVLPASQVQHAMLAGLLANLHIKFQWATRCPGVDPLAAPTAQGTADNIAKSYKFKVRPQGNSNFIGVPVRPPATSPH